MHPVSLSSRLSPPAVNPASPSPKLLRAAEQFEGLLLNMLLGPMEKSFSSLPGQKDMPGDADYNSMATQALATAVAKSGGLGIGGMIVRNVMNHQAFRAESQAKVSASAADR